MAAPVGHAIKRRADFLIDVLLMRHNSRLRRDGSVESTQANVIVAETDTLLKAIPTGKNHFAFGLIWQLGYP